MHIKKFSSKILTLILMFALSNLVLAQSGVRPKVTETPNAITIMAGTPVKIELETPISSKLNDVGDEVVARLTSSLIINGAVVLKRGTEFHGQISQISPAKRPQRQASLAITFDKIITPYGEQEVSTVIKAIDDFANESKLNADDEGRVKGGHSGGKTVDNAVKGGVLGGAIAPIIYVTGGPIAGATIPLGGVLAGILVSKGNDIKLFPGTLLRIEITKPIIIKLKDEELATPENSLPTKTQSDNVENIEQTKKD